MKKRGLSRSFARSAGAAGLLWFAVAACGQEQAGPNYGSVELGLRQNWGTVYGRATANSLFPSFPGTTGGTFPESSGGPFTAQSLGYTPRFGTSRFFEYQDVPNGLYIKSFRAGMDNVLGKNFYIKLQGRDGIEKDQAYLLTAGQYGKTKFQFRWDDTPHVFTNTAQTLFAQTAPGFFTTSPVIQAALTAGAATCTFQQIAGGACALANTVNSLFSTATPFALDVRRRAATASFAWRPTANWDLGTSYSLENASGSRPFGTSSGFEFPEPINYRTQNVKGSAEYGQEHWGVQVGFTSSLFDNRVGSLTWVSPFSTAATTNQGRIDLYPSNTAGNVPIAGAFDLTKYVRVMGSIVTGWMKQNDAFLPYTVNSGATGCPGGQPCNAVAALPAASLNGSKTTLAMNYIVATRPMRHLSFTARYGSYDYENNSPTVTFPGVVVTDGATFASGGDNARVSVPKGFNRKNVEFTGAWQFKKDDVLKVGYGLEIMDRQHRDVSHTQEGTFSTSLDLNPNKLTLLRFSYKHSDRTPELYQNNDESYFNGEGGTAQMFAFRRFDEAQRTRNRGEALLQVTPLPALTFSAVYSTDQNAFANHLSATECAAATAEATAQAALSSVTLVAPFDPSCLSYGLLKDISSGYSFDANYSPVPQLAFFGEYANEKFNYQQRSRDRTYVTSLQAAPAAIPGVRGAYDDPSNDWFSWSSTRIHTYSGGVDVYLKRKKVAMTTFYSLSAATGDILTTLLSANPTMSATNVTTGALVTPALAGGPGYYNYPNTTNRLHQVVVSAKFAVSKSFTPRIEYQFQRYDQHDWQSDIMLPYMAAYDPGSSYNTSASRLGGGTQKFLYLGADTPSYKTHVLTGTLEWHF